jgi:hypothetical protein
MRKTVTLPKEQSVLAAHSMRDEDPGPQHPGSLLIGKFSQLFSVELHQTFPRSSLRRQMHYPDNVIIKTRASGLVRRLFCNFA